MKNASATSLAWPEGIGLAYRIVIVQFAVTLATTLSMSLVAAEQAIAAVCGGLVCILPTAAFAACATRCRKPGRVVLMGAVKPMAVIGLMVLAFVLAKPAPLGFFVALATVHLAYVAAPLLDRREGRIGGRTDGRAAFKAAEPGQARTGQVRAGQG